MQCKCAVVLSVVSHSQLCPHFSISTNQSLIPTLEKNILKSSVNLNDVSNINVCEIFFNNPTCQFINYHPKLFRIRKSFVQLVTICRCALFYIRPTISGLLKNTEVII